MGKDMWVAFHLPADSQEHTTSQNMVQNLRPATQRFWTLGSETIHSKWSQWHCRPKPKSISWFFSAPKILILLPKKKNHLSWRSSPKPFVFHGDHPNHPFCPSAWEASRKIPGILSSGSRFSTCSAGEMDPNVNGLVFLGKSSPGTMDFPMKHGGGPEVSLCFTRMVGKKNPSDDLISPNIKHAPNNRGKK